MHTRQMKRSLFRGKVSESAVHQRWTDNSCETHRTRESALQFTLLIGRYMCSNNRLQRRTANSSQAIRDKKSEHHPCFCSESKENQSQCIKCKTNVNTF